MSKKLKRPYYRRPQDQAWYKAHPELAPAAPPVRSIPISSKLLRVQTGYFTAGAVWKRIHGIWSCVETAPILKWMRGMDSGQAKLALLKMHATFEWVPNAQVQTGISQPVAEQPTGIDPALS